MSLLNFAIPGYYGRGAVNVPRPDKSANTESIRTNLSHLSQQVAHQALIIKALTELVIESGIVSEEALLGRMDDIDFEDGKRSGGTTGKGEPKVCPSCKKNNAQRLVSCLFCGTELPQSIAL